MKFNKVNPEIFNQLQVEAGILLSSFDPLILILAKISTTYQTTQWN